MAVVEQTRYTYTGDGVTREFPIVFRYLRGSDVVVQVDGQDVAYTFSQGNSFVRLVDVPSVGAEVVVKRSTEARNPLHEFQHGSPLVPGYLDENFKQVLYTVSESAGDTSRAEQAAIIAEGAAQTAAQAAAAATQEAQAAIAEAEAARTLAEEAHDRAWEGISDAASAKGVANNALQQANLAGQVAVAAAQSASDAQLRAQGAESVALDALQQIEDAVSGSVTSFNGRTGAVLPQANDYAIEDIAGLTDALEDINIPLADNFGLSIDMAPTQRLVTSIPQVHRFPAGSNINTLANITPGLWYLRDRHESVGGTWPYGELTSRLLFWVGSIGGRHQQQVYRLDGLSRSEPEHLTRRYNGSTWSAWERTLDSRDIFSTGGSIRPSDKDSWGEDLLPSIPDITRHLSNEDPYSRFMWNYGTGSGTNRVWKADFGVLFGNATSTTEYAFRNRTPATLAVRFILASGAFGINLCPAHLSPTIHTNFSGILRTNTAGGSQATVEVIVAPGEYIKYSTRPSYVHYIVYKYAEEFGGDFPADPFERISV